MLTKKIASLIISLFLLVASGCTTAKDVHVAIKLTKIAAEKTSERAGDKLYFSISEYPNNSEPKLTRVPMFPLHWLSKDLPKHKNTKLWEGKVTDSESVLLIFSLIEQDILPFDPDHHVGSAQVKLINKGGKLSVKWGQPHFNDQPKVDQTNTKFVMFGNGSKYDVEFKLEDR